MTGPIRGMILGASAMFVFAGCARTLIEAEGIEIQPNLEDVAPDGTIYSPSTQSFLRHQHWLDGARYLDLDVTTAGIAEIELRAGDDEEMRFNNIEMEQLMPRLFYPLAGPPDEFDAYNLMLAEYSRNSISFPTGDPGDDLTHFQTTLDELVAWKVPETPYQFRGDPRFRPLRMSVVNNCLGPGLFELNAVDGAGEIYHSWFSFPNDEYHELVAYANGIEDLGFVRDALVFKKEPVTLDLDRLRVVNEKVGEVVPSVIADGRSGYSSQGSRRKLAKGYALVPKNGQLSIPQSLAELTELPVHLSEFIEPGKYSISERRKFDLTWLRNVRRAEVFRVSPKTHYQFLDEDATPDPSFRGAGYLEIRIHFDEYSIVLGNLPESMLVPQEDFEIHGFGVGVVAAGEPAERRKLLYEEGPSPSFAYLYRREGDQRYVLNSHEFGLEQVFLRVRMLGDEVWFEPAITSYERIVDLAKFRIPVPPELVDELNDLRRRYISPTFLTYRDDNVR